MSKDTTVYLHVTIQVVRGKFGLFAAAMGEMVPVLEENGWRLVGGFTTGLGRLGAVYHVWQVPSPNAALDVLAVVRAHPDAARWGAAFAESIEDEVVEVVQPTPYSRTP